MTTNRPANPHRPRLTLRTVMIAVGVIAVLLALVRVAVSLGFLVTTATILVVATRAVTRRSGLPWGRAAVRVLTVYGWLTAAIWASAIVLLASIRRGSWAETVLGIPVGIGLALTLAAPPAAAANLVLSLGCVCPVYYRGGSDHDADAWPMLGRPFLAWVTALLVFLFGVPVVSG